MELTKFNDSSGQLVMSVVEAMRFIQLFARLLEQAGRHPDGLLMRSTLASETEPAPVDPPGRPELTVHVYPPLGDHQPVRMRFLEQGAGVVLSMGLEQAASWIKVVAELLASQMTAPVPVASAKIGVALQERGKPDAQGYFIIALIKE